MQNNRQPFESDQILAQNTILTYNMQHVYSVSEIKQLANILIKTEPDIWKKTVSNEIGILA